jgi:hypothetical protein
MLWLQQVSRLGASGACEVFGLEQPTRSPTARSLMSRAKVPADHAERCLGHVMGGVRGTYDRYEYLEEKRDAFEKPATVIGNILAEGQQ